MKHRLAVAVSLLLAATGVAVAEGPQRQMFVVHQEIAKPSKVVDYEATSREFVALVKAHKAKMPHFSFDCLMGPDLTYTYVAPIPNLAGMDAINAEFGALAQAAGAAFADLMKRGGATTEYIKEWIVERSAEMSYTPAQPRPTSGETGYFHYTFYYVQPGLEAEADALGADYVKLFKAKNVAMGYDMYKTVLGSEMPLYVVSVGAKDAADFHAQDAKLQALLGAEGAALNARALAVTRRLETREAVYRADLSVPAQ